jgi:hypothetical protein
MKNELKQWLQNGDTAPFEYENNGYSGMAVRVPMDGNFDYIFCQRHYGNHHIDRSDTFEYAGIYCKIDGEVYDFQHQLSQYDDCDGARGAGKLLRRFEAEVIRIVSELVGDDRHNLKITKITDRRSDIEYYKKYTAPERAREIHLATSEGDEPNAFGYKCGFCADYWTESSLLDYILNPTGYERKIANEYFDAHQEQILFSFLTNDAVKDEYAAIISNPDNTAHITKRIIAAVDRAGAKTVTVTITRNGEEFTFKTGTYWLKRDCTSTYSCWDISAADKRGLEKRFGRHFDYTPAEIVRIEYARKTIYEVQNGG